jgi:hypothetical protein
MAVAVRVEWRLIRQPALALLCKKGKMRNRKQQMFELGLSTSICGGVNVWLTKLARTKKDAPVELLYVKDVYGIASDGDCQSNNLPLALGALIADALKQVKGLDYAHGTIMLSAEHDQHSA